MAPPHDLPLAVTAFAALPVACTVMELDGTIVAVNPAGERLLGRPAATIIGQKAWAFAPGGDHIWAERVAAARAGSTEPHDIVLATPSGTLTIEYVVAVRELEGREVLLAVAMDVSRHTRGGELDAARAALESAQRLEALGLVAGGIAHDFNNQLVSVLAEASAVREDPGLSGEAREALRRIEGAASRMAQLNRQLLAYAGRGRFVTELIDPDDLVQNAQEQLAKAVRAEARLVILAGAGPVAVEADRSLLGQVVANLGANASDALPAGGGQITIATNVVSRGGSAWWQLEVADDGAGMEPETLARIFDPFFSTKVGRHGLGLSAVHGIVRRLNGDIEVDSRPGRGSRFRVRLPVVPGAQPTRTRQAGQPTSGTTLHGLRVLVADDEPSVRATVRRLLERRGATVIVAADKTDAEEKLYKGHYGLVVFDVMMPGRTGYQLVGIARQLQPGAHVVLMSGYTERARGAGGEDEPDVFLEKPFSAKVLDHAIDQLLARRR